MSFLALRGRCLGRWPDIVAALSTQVEMIDAIERGHYRRGYCPVHGGDHGDAFRVQANFTDTGGAHCTTCGRFATGFALLMWLNDWSTEETSQAIEDYLIGAGSTRAPQAAASLVLSSPEQDTAPPFRLIRRIWNEGYLLRSPRAKLLRQYLAQCGLSCIQPMPLTLRFHPRMQYTEFGSSEPLDHLPVMMASIVGPDGKTVGLYRTYLAADGRLAAVKAPKNVLRVRDATLSGGAVRLFDAGPVLGITKSLESGLAVHAGTGLPVWAALKTELLESLWVPPAVRRVIIWAENGRTTPGKSAADSLVQRLAAEGRDVEIRYPSLPAGAHGVTWNDVLMEQGVAGFPAIATEAPPLPTVYSLLRSATG